MRLILGVLLFSTFSGCALPHGQVQVYTEQSQHHEVYKVGAKATIHW